MPNAATVDPLPALLGGAGRSMSDRERIRALELDAAITRDVLTNHLEALQGFAMALAALDATLKAIVAQSDALPGEHPPAKEERPN